MDEDEEIEEAVSLAPARKQVSSGQVTLFAWVAILTACCVVAIITLQVIEMLTYSSPPSVWPDPLAAPPPKTAPAPETLIEDELPADAEAATDEEALSDEEAEPGEEAEPAEDAAAEEEDEAEADTI